jgi:excisionase family DNA binding protein
MTRKYQKSFKSLVTVADTDTALSSEWLSTKEVARYLQTNIQTVCGLAKSGRLKASFLLNKYLIQRSDLDAFLKSQAVPPKLREHGQE